MIRFGLRLTLKGGKEAAVRLVITAAAMALGVAMLLIAVAGIKAVNAQNARYAWLETGASPTATTATAATTTRAATDPLWWLLTADEFHGKIIGRVDVAATGPNSPVPPGVAHLPGPGQFYASPALSRLLHSTPDAELDARYPGRQIGTIGSSALPSPSSLIILIGRRPDQISHVPNVERVTSISTTVPSSCNGACFDIGINASGIDLVLSIAAAALLLPVLIFIGTATRLSAARREQRFAAIRLVGGTPRQISVISTVESTVAATAGVVAGFGLFFVTRPALATIPFTGTPFFRGDLSLSLADILVVAIGVPVAAAVAARLALRRVQISPLGVSRRVTPRAPRAFRLIPLVAGIGELALFAAVGRPSTTPEQIAAYLPGILLIMAGLVSAGPWLTMIGSRVMARRTSRPEVLIAARRLSDNPKAGFRAISGLVLALFVTSVAIGVITTIDAYHGPTTTSSSASDILVDQFTDFTASAPPSTSVPSIPKRVLTELHSIPGVEAVTLIHSASNNTGDDNGRPIGTVSCVELARTAALGRCPADAVAVTITNNFGLESGPGLSRTAANVTWRAADISSERLARLPVQLIVVDTNGSTPAIEHARTVLEVAYPYVYSPATISEDRAQNPNTQLDSQYQHLVDVVILTSLLTAGCSLAVSVAAGLSDRRRPFSLLRLTGVPLGMLRRVVALESAVPLLVIAALSTATGFLAAGLFVSSQLHETLQPPGAAFYLIVVVGLVASLAIITSTLPLLNRITGPETARNE